MPTSISRAKALTRALASILEQDPRVASGRTAKVLRAGGPAGLSQVQPEPSWNGMMRTALAGSDHPAAPVLLDAFDLIPWGENPIAGQLAKAPDIYLVSTLLGPDGPVSCPDLRMGLFFQRPDTYYGLHLHNAIESYFILAGEAVWTAGDDTSLRRAGDMIHHPSRMPHAFRAGPLGLLAVWRWNGDIDVRSYAMLDDPLAQGDAA